MKSDSKCRIYYLTVASSKTFTIFQEELSKNKLKKFYQHWESEYTGKVYDSSFRIWNSDYRNHAFVLIGKIAANKDGSIVKASIRLKPEVLLLGIFFLIGLFYFSMSSDKIDYHILGSLMILIIAILLFFYWRFKKAEGKELYSVLENILKSNLKELENGV